MAKLTARLARVQRALAGTVTRKRRSDLMAELDAKITRMEKSR